VVFFNYMN